MCVYFIISYNKACLPLIHAKGTIRIRCNNCLLVMYLNYISKILSRTFNIKLYNK